MEIEIPNTKTALILAAGPLFAEKGEASVSVRTIASLADANVASINYHFGSKENLYIATVRYVLEKTHTTYLHEAWAQLPQQKRNRAEMRDFIIRLVRTTYEDFFCKGNPLWFYLLLHREISAPTKAFAMIRDNIVLPDHAAAREIFDVLKPEAKKWEADNWTCAWYGQLFFFSTAVNSILNIYGWREGIDPEYLEQTLDTTTKMALALLGYEI